MSQRKTLVVEPEIQFALVRQLYIHWALHLTASLAFFTMLQVFSGGLSKPFEDHWAVVRPVAISLTLSMLFLLPAFVRNTLVLSNRFVGPIHRFRNALRSISAGNPHRPFKFRDGDYWPMLAGELDAAIEVLQGKEPSNTTDASVPGGGVSMPSSDEKAGSEVPVA